MDPVPNPTFPDKFIGYSRGSSPGPLGWQSDMLITRLYQTVGRVIMILWYNNNNNNVKVKVSPLQAMKTHGGVDARVHIYTATTLGRGRVDSPTLGRLDPPGNPAELFIGD